MQVIPPKVVQPQEIEEKTPQLDNKPLEANRIIENSDHEVINNTSTKNALSTIEDKGVIIRKKRQYNAFIKLIKKGKFTSGVLTARLLGVDNHTISKWLNTPKVIDLMNNTYNTYIDDIAKSKDWKAKAYLIDKLEDNDKTNTATNLTNLIQINI